MLAEPPAKLHVYPTTPDHRQWRGQRPVIGVGGSGKRLKTYSTCSIPRPTNRWWLDMPWFKVVNHAVKEDWWFNLEVFGVLT